MCLLTPTEESVVTLANLGRESIAHFQFKLFEDNHLIKILGKFPIANDWRDVGYAISNEVVVTN
jgi:hypothetical protein